MNIGTYISYILIASIVIIYVGNACYKNGKVYILNYFPNDVSFGNGINNVLRVAYYFLNIGLVIWTLRSLRNIQTIEESITEICTRLAYILLIIGMLHFMNILAVYLLHKNHKKQIHETKYN